MNRANVKVTLNQCDDALADLNSAVELDPEIEEAREYLQKMGVPGY